MALKRVEITELKGINRNAVEGVTQMQPVSLTGVNFDRGGGYLKVNDGDSQITLSGTFSGTLVGSDDRGLVSLYLTGASTSFPNGEITLRTYDGDATVEEDVYGLASGTMTTSSSFFSPVHYPSVGVLAYTGDFVQNDIYKAVFLVKRNDGTYLGASDLYGGSYSITSQAITGTGSIINSVQFWAGIPTDAGTFLAPLASWYSSSIVDGSQYSATLTYTGAPDTWTVFGVGRTVQTATVQNAYYEVAVGDVSGSTTVNITSASAVFTSPIVVQFQEPVALHRQRTYGRFLYPSLDASTRNFDSLQAGGATANAFKALISGLPLKKTVWYTEIGYANLMSGTNYVVVPLTASSEITGLAPSPAGVLVFGDSETHLIRSDPALSDFGIQFVSGVVGMDSGTNPVRLGGTIFTIYKGEIYAISLGMGDVDFGSGIQKLSDPVYDPDDPFTDIATGADDRFLVAMTASAGFTFDAEKQEWLTNSTIDTRSPDNIFSNPDSDGVRYYTSSNSRLYSVSGGSLYFAEVQYRDIDVGDKHLRKLWRRVRINMNDSFSGNMLVDYNANGTSGTVTASNEGEGTYVATLPSGLVSTKIDLELRPIMASGDTIEPPITIEFVERYRRN